MLKYIVAVSGGVDSDPDPTLYHYKSQNNCDFCALLQL